MTCVPAAGPFPEPPRPPGLRWAGPRDGARGDTLSGMTDEHSARIEAHLDAPPERVWHALTDADALTAWYWPAALHPRATSDPRAGGRFALVTADPAMGFDGTYAEFAPPYRMVQTWHWNGDDRDSRVTVELAAAGAGTALVVTHDRLDAQTAENYRQGWRSCLDRLPGYLA